VGATGSDREHRGVDAGGASLKGKSSQQRRAGDARHWRRVMLTAAFAISQPTRQKGFVRCWVWRWTCLFASPKDQKGARGALAPATWSGSGGAADGVPEAVPQHDSGGSPRSASALLPLLSTARPRARDYYPQRLAMLQCCNAAMLLPVTVTQQRGHALPRHPLSSRAINITRQLSVYRVQRRSSSRLISHSMTPCAAAAVAFRSRASWWSPDEGASQTSMSTWINSSLVQ
jgi:hypothetical protein